MESGTVEESGAIQATMGASVDSGGGKRVQNGDKDEVIEPEPSKNAKNSYQGE